MYIPRTAAEVMTTAWSWFHFDPESRQVREPGFFIAEDGNRYWRASRPPTAEEKRETFAKALRRVWQYRKERLSEEARVAARGDQDRLADLKKQRYDLWWDAPAPRRRDAKAAEINRQIRGILQ